jgi:RpiB/LacA/LacB family sugar-phosphate isomerase
MSMIDPTAHATPKVTESTSEAIDRLCVNTIRTLAMDAVQAANSGHPGTPMALAPVTYCLWQRVLRFDPDHPISPNRDRFVLSVGHASMLLYAMLHLTGTKAINPKYETLGRLSVTLEDTKSFRQLESKDFGANSLSQDDDYPDFVTPLGHAVATGQIERGVAIRGSGVRASVCANKIAGVRAALIHDHFSARQGVEDDHINILCMGGRTVGPAVAWDLVQTFLAAEFSKAERHLRRLGKVASLEVVRGGRTGT